MINLDKQMAKATLNPKTELCKVKPTNSLFFIGSGPAECELGTANIRNKTVDSMMGGDVRAVTYRYLQARAGEDTNFIDARYNAIITVVFLIPGLCCFTST